MPYNPGVQDIRGQLLAQGISSAGDSMADAIKAYGQNKLLAGQSIAKFEGAAKANPELMQFLTSPDAPQEAGKAYKKLMQGGNVPLKDAAVLAQFSDAFTKSKEETQQAQMRAMQMQAAQAQMAEAERQRKQTVLNQQALQASMAPVTSIQSATGDAIQGGANFNDLLQNNTPTTAPVRTTTQPSAYEAARKFLQQGGAPDAHTGQFLNSMMDAETAAAKNTAGGAPTVAAKNTEAIIFAEWKAGKLKAEEFDKRRAELMGAGGRNPAIRGAEQPFQMGQSYGDKNGKFLGVMVFDQRDGKAMINTPEGKRIEIPEDARPVTATAMQKHVPAIQEFRKFKADVTDAEVSLRALDRYLGSVESADVGYKRMADTFTGGMKTLMGGKDPLNAKEIAAKAAQGQLQGLLGSNRTNIVGGGTMTETDAIRIIQRLGGDAGALQNPEIVRKAIRELYADRLGQYQDDLKFYNQAVDDYYGERGHKRIEQKTFSDKLSGGPADEPLQIKSVKKL